MSAPKTFERNFFVINLKDLDMESEAVRDAIEFLHKYATVKRIMRRAAVNPRYYVCNSDEPYADTVLSIILDRPDSPLKRIAELETGIHEAVRIIAQGKAQFAPHTTNSDADVFLSRYGAPPPLPSPTVAPDDEPEACEWKHFGAGWYSRECTSTWRREIPTDGKCNCGRPIHVQPEGGA